MTGIRDANHAVEPGVLTDEVVDEERLNDGRGVREAGHFNQDPVETALAPDQPRHHADQITTHLATDATVVQFDDLVFSAHDKAAIDTDRAVLVDDHRIAPAMLLAQNAIEKRGLAGAEKPGENRNRDPVHCQSRPFARGTVASKSASSLSSRPRSDSIACKLRSASRSRSRNCAISCVSLGDAPSRFPDSSAHASSISAPARRLSPRKCRELTSVNAMTRRTRSKNRGVMFLCDITAVPLKTYPLRNQHSPALHLAMVQVFERLVRLTQTVFAGGQMDQSTIGERHQLDEFGIGADQVANNGLLAGDHVDRRQLDLP